MKEAAEQQWAYRTLDRNIATQYYERLLLSQVKSSVKREMKSKTKEFQNNKLEFIKNPTVLEFLGLPGKTGYSEKILEKALIDHLQQFLLELGKGFSFVERQQLVRTETTDYYVDLVFYNYILKCFILIDLKTNKITHQDVGQMDMYVRMYDDLKRGKDDNPTIGIVLCSQTDEDIARYSILKGNERLFATKYKLYLPTEEELRLEIEREKELIQIQLEKIKTSKEK
jgi:predicted nuclease of restriction endonuclease-like (RecB) superfamily